MTDLRVSLPAPCSENWEEMQPSGCNRLCAQCDMVIHDLSQLTVDEAEALLASNQKVCVRAKLDPSGAVQLKTSRVKPARRMVATIGASMSLATAACQTGNFPPRATIAGKVEPSWMLKVKARSSDGRTYRANVKPDGTFELKNLFFDVYTLSFKDMCGRREQVENVVVRDSRVEVGKIEWEYDCIIVGHMMLEDGDKQG